MHQEPTSIFFDIPAGELNELGTPFAIHALYYSSPEMIMSYDKFYGKNRTFALFIDKKADYYTPPAPSVSRLIDAPTGAALRTDTSLAGTSFDEEYIDTVPMRQQANKLGMDIPTDAIIRNVITLIDQQLETYQD
ncbi:MAG: hypothetical protein JWN75_255 [Candidatus Saccharibacteria bacterium]|nr:hypothetical protein [Candidatus Saccharibacteria bacterium]